MNNQTQTTNQKNNPLVDTKPASKLQSELDSLKSSVNEINQGLQALTTQFQEHFQSQKAESQYSQKKPENNRIQANKESEDLNKQVKDMTEQVEMLTSGFSQAMKNQAQNPKNQDSKLFEFMG